MTITTITLPSDGLPMDVMPLGLFDLDVEQPEDIGRYAYEMKLVTGETALVEFPLENFPEPPPEPRKPIDEIQEKTADWYKLATLQRYQAAIAQENRRAEQTVEYVENVSRRILRDCISPDDRQRILDQDDWAAIYTAALLPQLTMELIVLTLKKTYRASYDDEEVFEALGRASGGKGKYDGVRLWENETMIAMGMTEFQWAQMPLGERARKVVAQQLPRWMGFLETDDQNKRMELDRLQRGLK